MNRHWAAGCPPDAALTESLEFYPRIYSLYPIRMDFTVSKAPQKPASAGKTLSYRALFWRSWIVASLG